MPLGVSEKQIPIQSALEEVTRHERGAETPARRKTRKSQLAEKSHGQRIAVKTRSDVDVLDDGFKWRKYGQKAVKNCRHPRGYYHCVERSCTIKKRVQRLDMDPNYVLTTYEGFHNHPTPMPIVFTRKCSTIDSKHTSLLQDMQVSSVENPLPYWIKEEPP